MKFTLFRTFKSGGSGIESGVATQGRGKVEVETLLLGNDKNNVIVDKVLSYYYFFDKTNLQKPHCVMIENISSNNKT